MDKKSVTELVEILEKLCKENGEISQLQIEFGESSYIYVSKKKPNEKVDSPFGHEWETSCGKIGNWYVWTY